MVLLCVFQITLGLRYSWHCVEFKEFIIWWKMAIDPKVFLQFIIKGRETLIGGVVKQRREKHEQMFEVIK